MKRVYVARNPTDAHLLKGILEAEDIPAVVRGEDLFGARGGAPLTSETCPSVWVLEEVHFDRAHKLAIVYSRREEPKGVRGIVWRCAGCGETLEPQFTQCWQCGASRTGKAMRH